MTYDTAGMGNIASRSDVDAGAAWTYDPVKIHAVTQIGTGAGSRSYTYDANGNAITRDTDATTWNSANYLTSTYAGGGESVSFNYGPNRNRWKTVYTGSIGTETTYHVGKLLEKVANGGVLDYRHYIFAGSELVAIYSRTSAGTNTLRYSLMDHQGSFASILTSTGTLDVSESFTAYGIRRSGETWSGAPTSGDEAAIDGVSRRGFTGQTALGVSMGLHHFNGRVEDSITGRFLSPDPHITDPANPQSYNRYSYVNNNPVTMTDPTGFDVWTPNGGLGSDIGSFGPDSADLSVIHPSGSDTNSIGNYVLASGSDGGTSGTVGGDLTGQVSAPTNTEGLAQSQRLNPYPALTDPNYFSAQSLASTESTDSNGVPAAPDTNTSPSMSTFVNNSVRVTAFVGAFTGGSATAYAFTSDAIATVQALQAVSASGGTVTTYEALAAAGELLEAGYSGFALGAAVALGPAVVVGVAIGVGGYYLYQHFH